MQLLRRYIPKLLRMVFGFALIALGTVIAKQSYCLAPWNVFNDGLSHSLGITLGQANIVVGTSILVIDLLLREKFGLGMVLNIWLVGVFTDLYMALNATVTILPKVEFLPLQLLCGVLALCCNAFGIYFYMSARMGAGPRDTIIVFLTKHLPLPVGACKLGLEAVVCLIGWLIGGEVGLGTLLFVFGGGPLLQLVFRLFRFDVKAAKNESLWDTWKIISGKSSAE